MRLQDKRVSFLSYTTWSKLLHRAASYIFTEVLVVLHRCIQPGGCRPAQMSVWNQRLASRTQQQTTWWILSYSDVCMNPMSRLSNPTQSTWPIQTCSDVFMKPMSHLLDPRQCTWWTPTSSATSWLLIYLQKSS